MAKERTAGAKLASRGKVAAPKSAGSCSCGGELIWTRVYTPRARMMKVCEKCGAELPKTLNGNGL